MDSKTSSRWPLATALAGLVAILTAVALALFHLCDLSRIQHIAGVWMGLAGALNDGVLYPPLDDAGFYGGTRYMPPVFALIAALARLTGDILVAAKLTAQTTINDILQTAVREVGQALRAPQVSIRLRGSEGTNGTNGNGVSD